VPKKAVSPAPAGFDGTRSELAAYLGISERTLYRRLKRQNLDNTDPGSRARTSGN
jgi:DNA-binding NtrC family response regulator